MPIPVFIFVTKYDGGLTRYSDDPHYFLIPPREGESVEVYNYLYRVLEVRHSASKSKRKCSLEIVVEQI